MGRQRKRKGRGGGARWGLRALIAAGATALGVAGVTCRPERWLEGLEGTGPAGPPRPAPTSSRGSPPKGQAPRAPAPSVHLELGTPARKGGGGGDDDRLLIKPEYALSYHRGRSVANWVSWQLDASYFGDAPRHRGRFLADATLPEGFYRVTHDDYTGSGFDRGHMVRSEERTRSPEDNRTTFLLTNILPQQHDLNAGPWLRLEEHCQELSQREGRTLFVVAGGLFGARPRTIGKDVAVPEAFFKIAVVLDKGQGADDVGPGTRVIAVVMPNQVGLLDQGWGGYRTTVDEVERRAGYDFLTAVPEATQQAIEGRVDDGPTDRR